MTISDSIVRPAVVLLDSLGWETVECRDEVFGPDGTLGRETKGQVVLVERLRAALERLNPGTSDAGLARAVEELERDRGALGLIAANREIHQLLRDGCPGDHLPPAAGPDSSAGAVRYIDWDRPEANDFVVAPGFAVTGETRTRRCSLVGFVNGIPLLVAEFAPQWSHLEDVFDHVLVTHMQTIPRLFWYNAFCLVSTGLTSRVGPIGAPWEHFGEWKRVAAEEEAPSTALETALQGTCEKRHLLDLVENGLLFMNTGSGLTKVMARYHQHLGVDAALSSLRELPSNQGRLGMFWHAQGSGKGISMLLFAQKVQRKLPGSWTFVVVTDRDELGQQVYRAFVNAGVAEAPVRVESCEELSRSLGEHRRCVIAPLEVFETPAIAGRRGPVSERFDVVVMTDEAHGPARDQLALSMRDALPNAAFLGFTSTPLGGGEAGFRQVFGDYASIYNFRESIDDGVTVPLYYEHRLSEVQVAAGGLGSGLEEILREAESDCRQEARLEQDPSRLYYVLTDDDRLDMVARDIVKHMVQRGYLGKALVVSIDRITAARMYEKVRASWDLQLAGMRLQLGPSREGAALENRDGHEQIDRRLAYWAETDMAVVVSRTQNDIEEFHKRGVDIVTHLERAAREDLLARFNDPADPLRLVFTCNEWIGGVDTAACSTVYLDKPLRDHALMQAVSRANRSYGHKTAGLVIDYGGVFEDPRRALAAYAAGNGSGVAPGDLPVAPKSRLLKELRKALSAVTECLRSAGFEPEAVLRAPQLPKLRLVDDAVNAVLKTPVRKEQFLSLAKRALSLYRAVLPDPGGDESAMECALFALMVKRIRALSPEPGMSAAEKRLVRLLEDTIEAEGYAAVQVPAIPPGPGRTTAVRKLAPDDAGLFGPGPVDLARIDLGTVWKRFARSQKCIELERLRGAIDTKLSEMVRLNPTRATLRDKFGAFVAEATDEGNGEDALFARLIDLVQEMDAEGGRAAQLGLSEEELAVFDLFTKPGPALTVGEGEQVKESVRALLADLKVNLLAGGWRQDRQVRAAVRTRVEKVLDALPASLSTPAVVRRADLVFQHVYDSYPGSGRSIYSKS